MKKAKTTEKRVLNLKPRKRPGRHSKVIKKREKKRTFF